MSGPVVIGDRESLGRKLGILGLAAQTPVFVVERAPDPEAEIDVSRPKRTHPTSPRQRGGR